MKFQLAFLAFLSFSFAEECSNTSFVLSTNAINPYCYQNSDCTVRYRGSDAEDTGAICNTTTHVCDCSPSFFRINGVCVNDATRITKLRTVVHLPDLNKTLSDEEVLSSLKGVLSNNARDNVPTLFRNQTEAHIIKLFRQDEVLVYEVEAPAAYQDNILLNTEYYLNRAYDRTSISLRGNRATPGRCYKPHSTDSVAVSRCSCWATSCEDNYRLVKSSLSPAEWHCTKDKQHGLTNEEIAAVVIASVLLCCLLIVLLLCCFGGNGKAGTKAVEILPEAPGQYNFTHGVKANEPINDSVGVNVHESVTVQAPSATVQAPTFTAYQN